MPINQMLAPSPHRALATLWRVRAFRIGWSWLCLATASRESSLRSRARRGRGKSTILLVRTATYSSEKTNITPSESRMRAYRAVQLHVYRGAQSLGIPLSPHCAVM